MAYNRHDSCLIAAPSLSFDCLVDGRKKGSYRKNGAVKAREVDSKPPPPQSCVAVARPISIKAVRPLRIGKLARGWDLFTCIPASTTKSSGLNAPTTAVQPFLGFVESGFPFTHNGGTAPTRQAATGHNALFSQQIHFEVDLFARPIVGMCTRYHKGPISQ